MVLSSLEPYYRVYAALALIAIAVSAIYFLWFRAKFDAMDWPPHEHLLLLVIDTIMLGGYLALVIENEVLLLDLASKPSSDSALRYLISYPIRDGIWLRTQVLMMGMILILALLKSYVGLRTIYKRSPRVVIGLIVSLSLIVLMGMGLRARLYEFEHLLFLIVLAAVTIWLSKRSQRPQRVAFLIFAPALMCLALLRSALPDLAFFGFALSSNINLCYLWLFSPREGMVDFLAKKEAFDGI